MGVIVKRVRLEGSKGEAEVEVLPRPYRFETAEAGRIIEAREAVRLDFYLNGDRLSDEFLVLPDEVATEEVIIGASTLEKWRLVLDFEREDVYSVRKVKKHMLK